MFSCTLFFFYSSGVAPARALLVSLALLTLGTSLLTLSWLRPAVPRYSRVIFVDCGAEHGGTTHLVLEGFLMFPASVTLYMRESSAPHRQACAHSLAIGSGSHVQDKSGYVPEPMAARQLFFEFGSDGLRLMKVFPNKIRDRRVQKNSSYMTKYQVELA